MIVLVLILLSTSMLFQNDVENGIVYPEVYPIIYFDPYLQEFDSNNKEILEENGDDFNQQESDFEALHRLTALMHETFIENQEGEELINFLPGHNKDFIVNTAPNGNQTETELTIRIPSDEQYWVFHDGTPITIQDIYYSIKYAMYTGKNIPSSYVKHNIELNQAENKIVILYKSKIAAPLLIKHFKQLIILPAKKIKSFVDGNAQLNSNSYNDLKKLYVKDLNNPSEIQSIQSAGPFRIHPNQSIDGKSLRLDKFDDYPNFNSEADVEVIKISPNDKKSSWFQMLRDGEYNLAVNISSVGSGGAAQVGKLGSYEVANLMVNHNDRYLKNKSFREALATIIDKEYIIGEILDGEAQLISGPYSKIEDSFAGFKIKQDEEKFHEIMSKLGYTRSCSNCVKYNYLNTNNKKIEIDLLYYYASNMKNVAITEQIINEIERQLENVGITVNPINKATNKALQAELNNGDFSLYYNVGKVQVQDNLIDYYTSDGKYNYGKFIPVDGLESKIKNLKDDCGDPVTCSIQIEEVWNALAKNYVNIYLWSPNYFYAYNTDYIDIDPWLVDPDQFFLEPHNWNIIEQDDE